MACLLEVLENMRETMHTQCVPALPVSLEMLFYEDDRWMDLPPLAITWQPPQPYLHYQELYRGIYEYLRAPPDNLYHSRALVYLQDLRRNYFPENGMVLQLHRIRWTEAWLEALDEPDSDTDTVVGDA